jgi:hypothetical protein
MMILLLALSLLLAPQAARPQFGVISGQVRADGSPVVGTRVAAIPVDEAEALTSEESILASLAQTDKQGRFRLENVPPGRYFIMAGYLDAPGYFPGVTRRQQARVVVVTAGSTTERIDFSLPVPSGVRVSGRITNLPGDAPMALFKANLVRVQAPSTERLEVSLKEGGAFEFSNVPPGNYTLRLSPLPMAQDNVRVAGDKDIDNVVHAAASMVFGRVTMDDGTPLPLQQEAVVTGVPDPPALIRLERAMPDVSGCCQSGVVRADGSFVFSFGTPGGYAIVPQLMPAGYYLKSATSGTVDLLKELLPVTGQSSQTEIKIVLTRTRPPSTPAGVKVSGRVNEMQRAPGGARVLVSMQSQIRAGSLRLPGQPMGYAAQVFVKEDGTFELTGVPPGPYALRTIPLSRGRSVDVGLTGINNIVLTLQDTASP